MFWVSCPRRHAWTSRESKYYNPLGLSRFNVAQPCSTGGLPSESLSMKAYQLTGLRSMALRSVSDPRIQRPTDVLIRIEAVGVCGSDVHYYTTGRIGCQVVEYPFTIGHECAGTVVAVGGEVTRVSRGRPRGGRAGCNVRRVRSMSRGTREYLPAHHVSGLPWTSVRLSVRVSGDAAAELFSHPCRTGLG